MEPVELNLPWPDRVMSPNSRSHWGAKWRAIKIYRSMTIAHCTKAKVHLLRKFILKNGPAINLEIIFNPPSKRSFDLDNCIASFKAGQDGIADALGVDDTHFKPTYAMEYHPNSAGVSVKIQQADGDKNGQ